MPPTPYQYIVRETIAAVVVNTVIGWGAFALVFGLHPAVRLWGRTGVALDLIPTFFMMTLMCVVVPTLLTRSRCRKGKLVGSIKPIARFVPRHLLLRALLFAIVMTALLWPITVCVLDRVGPYLWQFWPLFVFKTGIGFVVAVLVTPIALDAALRDWPCCYLFTEFGSEGWR